jgi:uncharacterized membrane protein
MRVTSWGHAVFAATMIAVGILGLVQREFAPIWLPVPRSLPAHHVLAYLCAIVSLASGVGLFWQRSAAVAARALFFLLLAWLMLVDGYQFFRQPGIPLAYAACQTAVQVAAAWVLFVRFAGGRDGQRGAFATGASALRLARMLYGLPLILFGIAHFTYLTRTTSMVPAWLPWHTAWAYLFGCTFIAAGMAVAIGVFARLAAVLSVIQIGMFTLLVWVPILAATPSAADWSESVVSWALTAAGWVVADSYRGVPWLTLAWRRDEVARSR